MPQKGQQISGYWRVPVGCVGWMNPAPAWLHESSSQNPSGTLGLGCTGLPWGSSLGGPNIVDATKKVKFTLIH